MGEQESNSDSPSWKREAGLALKDFILAGMSRGIFDSESVATLVAAVHAELGTRGASVPVVQWMEDHALNSYLRCHHDFAQSIRKSLPLHELQRLQHRSFDMDESNIDPESPRMGDSSYDEASPLSRTIVWNAKALDKFAFSSLLC